MTGGTYIIIRTSEGSQDPTQAQAQDRSPGQGTIQ